MSNVQDDIKRIYSNLNTVLESILTKVSQGFSADDWDALTSPDREDGYEPEKDNR